MRTILRRRPSGACRRTFFLLSLTFIVFVSAAAPARAASLAGSVVDPDGRPVAGARVVAETTIGAAADCTTDATGTWMLGDLRDGPYRLVTLAEGFQADPVDVDLPADQARRVDIRLRVSAVTESIVVSASPIDLPRSRVAGTVTVLTAADLAARQVETVADALRAVPGLAIARSGGRGAITSIFPRGGSSNYTLVLVDGMRANDFGGGFDFSRLTTSDIDRIEIVRGPESAVFGSDAIGGIVQIVTRRGGPAAVRGLVETGSQAAWRGAASASGSSGAWTWGGAVEGSRSEGYTGVAPATGERVTNDDSHQTHASGSLGWQRPGGTSVVLTSRVTQDERGFPGPFGSNPIGAFGGVDRISRGLDRTTQVGARITLPSSRGLRHRFDTSYTTVANDFTSPYGLSSSGTRRLDGRLQEDVALSRAVSLSAGLEFVDERGRSTYITGATGDPIDIQRRGLGTFGELRYTSRERLFVSGGVRVERLTRGGVEPNPTGFPPRPQFPSQTINSVNPKVAVSYLLTRPGASASTRLRASAGTGIRPPDAFEIAFTDNPNLKPERNRSIDAGVEQQFAGGAYTFAAVAFVNRYDDLIVAVGRTMENASQFQTDNIANARAQGLELTADARPGARIVLHGAYTFLDTAVLAVDGATRIAQPPYAVGEALVRRPRHQAAFEVTTTAGRAQVFAQILARSSMLDIEPNFGAFGGLFASRGYVVANAGVSVQVARNVHAYVRVLNMFDRAYEETLGYPALGRNGIVGLRIAASR